MAGEAAAAAARLPGAFPAARNGGVRRALRVPGSAATSGPVLRGLRGRRRAAGGAAEGLRRAKGNGAGLPSPARTSPSAGGRGAVPRAPAGRGGRWCPVLGALVGRQRAAVAGKCPSRPAPHCPLSLGGKTKRPWSREGEGAAVAPAVPSSPPHPRPSPRGRPRGPRLFSPSPSGPRGDLGAGVPRREPRYDASSPPPLGLRSAPHPPRAGRPRAGEPWIGATAGGGPGAAAGGRGAAGLHRSVQRRAALRLRCSGKNSGGADRGTAVVMCLAPKLPSV